MQHLCIPLYIFTAHITDYFTPAVVGVDSCTAGYVIFLNLELVHDLIHNSLPFWVSILSPGWDCWLR